MSQRYPFVDFIKGVSILGVIIIHIELLISPKQSFVFAGQLIDVIFRFAVPIFFGVQGYMTYRLYWGLDNWDPFLGKKALFSFLPYLLWSVVYFFTPDIFTRRPEMDKATSILFGYSDVHLYFMVAYLGFVGLIPFIVEGGKRCSAHTLKGMMWLVILLHMGLLVTVEQSIWQGALDHYYLTTDARLPLHWMAFFAAGFLIALDSQKWMAYFPKRFLSLVALTALYVLFASYLVASQRNYFIYYTPTLIPFSALALVLLKGWYERWQRSSVVSFFKFIGRHTFPVYLSHLLWIKLAFLYVVQERVSIGTLLLILVITIAASIAWIPIQERSMYKIGKCVFALTRRKRIARTGK